MKRKDIQELKNATHAELENRVKDMRAKLESLHFDKAAGKLKNGHAINLLRKDVARALTFLNLAKTK